MHVSASAAARRAEAQAGKEERRRVNEAEGGQDTEEANFTSYEKRVKAMPRFLSGAGGGGGGGGAGGAGGGAAGALGPLLGVPLGSSLLAHGGGAAAAAAAAAAAPPDPDRVAGLVDELAAQAARRKAFIRTHAVDEDVGGGAYINEANRSYVQKLAKTTDRYTLGIKQALERGTAL